MIVGVYYKKNFDDFPNLQIQKKIFEAFSSGGGRYMKGQNQKKYFKTSKGKDALVRARKAYDDRDPERRRKQKRDYMRRKRRKDPYYGR